MKKLILLLAIFLLPINTFAYSDYIYRGGNTLGIEVNTNGILIVGFYEINGEYNKGKLKVGDYIIKINDKEVNSLNELTNEVEKYTSDEYLNITFRRENKEYNTILPLKEENGVYKTGLFVKDNIIGIGTLTYIDPGTNIYGALGHEIVEGNTSKMVDISNGKIFKNLINDIDKSKTGYAGSKNAKYIYDKIYGTINKNSNHGIFGEYKVDTNDMELVKVGDISDIKVGDAKLYTVINGENVEEFDIKIKSINEHLDTKNMTIEITDEKLLQKTGGVVQGMSGSPIVQDDKIIGVLTHVIVDNPKTGYALFITKMLEEGERKGN